MITGNFDISGKPKDIHKYACFEDPARQVDECINGLEYLDNESNWDDKQKAKWNFFYRPAKPFIGKPQQDMINNEYMGIFFDELAIAEKRKMLNISLMVCSLILAVFFVVAVMGGGGFMMVLILVDILIAAGIFLFYKIDKSAFNQTVEKRKVKIDGLFKEIAELERQIPSYPTARQIDEWWREEIKYMEFKFLGEIVGAEIDENNIGNYIKHKKVDEYVHSLLILSWAAMQPETIPDSGGHIRKSGKHRVVEELKQNISTFRVGTNGHAIFRVWYLQYIFLLDNTLAVYSLFYDFINSEIYSLMTESFVYQHVTNYRVVQSDLSDINVIPLALPKELSQIFKKEVNEFELIVTSGSQFKCVLVDNQVVDGMNKWLKLRMEQEKLFNRAVTFEQFKTEFAKRKPGVQMDNALIQ